MSRPGKRLASRAGDSIQLQAERALIRVRIVKRLRQYWAPVAAAGLLCLMVFYGLLGIEVVSGASMSPALFSGDIVVYQRRWFQPRAGDMVIIQSDTRVDMLKRVVAVGGDEIDVLPDGHITRNGAEVYEPNVWYGWQDTRGWVDFPLILQQNSYFCMGDNRSISLDSRSASIGAVSRKDIVGRVLLTIRRQ